MGIFKFVFLSLLLSAGLVTIILWSEKWDQPKIGDVPVYDGLISGGGVSIHAKITCKCPSVFVVSKTQDVLFSISLGLPPTAPRLGQQQGAGRSLDGETHDVWVSVDALNVTLQGSDPMTPSQETAYVGAMSALSSGISQEVAVKMITKDTGPPRVQFHFAPALPGKPYDGALGSVSWAPDYHPAFLRAAAPFLYGGLVLICPLGILALVNWRFRKIQAKAVAALAEAERRSQENPESHYAWEIARIKLEAYFDRNLLQVNLVFWASIGVVIVGFGFIVAGVFLCFKDPVHIGTPLVAAVSGVFTQFIGATFMVIYRSTMGQANGFMAILERINTVNMAVQVLDRIPETSAELKNEVRARMVGLLLDRGGSPPAGAGNGKKADGDAGDGPPTAKAS